MKFLVNSKSDHNATHILPLPINLMIELIRAYQSVNEAVGYFRKKSN